MKKRTATHKPLRFDSEGYQVDMSDLNGEALPNPATLEFLPFSHGGARKGAGRKRTGRKAVLLRLSPNVVARLRAKAKAEHKTLSDVAEERLAAV